MIDNSKNGDENDITKNYGDIPETLVSVLCFLIERSSYITK